MNNKLILVGGGGHCKACIDVIEEENKYKIQGILDKEGLIGQKVLNYDVIGTDAMIPALVAQGYAFLITVGQIKSAVLRKKIYNELIKCKGEMVSIISPKAYLSKHASVGGGTVIMHGACINAGAVIGDNNIINTGAIIEHDVTIGQHCHISTGAVVNGACTIGNEVFIGSKATVANGMEIVDQVIVGAGSLIIQDIKQSGTYIGSPAKSI